jgi:hypothetical protein
MQRKRFEYGTWSWIILSGATVGAAVFAVWEGLQQNYFQDLDDRTLHYLYITRGIAPAFFLAAWAACIVMAQRRAYIARLRRSEMKYRAGQTVLAFGGIVNT